MKIGREMEGGKISWYCGRQLITVAIVAAELD